MLTTATKSEKTNVVKKLSIVGKAELEKPAIHTSRKARIIPAPKKRVITGVL